jgi:ribosomal protein S18 acetylase RimI-like enzyme
MATITSSLFSPTQKQIRPFDVRRDLRAAADLIELCFAETLSVDGRRYLQRMRAAAGGGGDPGFSSIIANRTSLQLAGYVWEEGGQLVGNLSLIPFFHRGRRIYMIANVAVHPDHRRRGIARALTKAAMEKSRRRRVSELWLQARIDNPPAVSLYTSMGFKPQAQRTTWNVHPKALRGEIPKGARTTIRSVRHWHQQEAWLYLNYPLPLRWHIPIKDQALKPGLLGMLYRFFTEVRVRHWAAQRKDRLLGVLTWQATHTHADHLWLAASPETEDEALQTILPFIRQEYRLHRPLSLEYPQGRVEDVLISAGFEPQHTLIWMKVKP